MATTTTDTMTGSELWQIEQQMDAAYERAMQTTRDNRSVRSDREWRPQVLDRYADREDGAWEQYHELRDRYVEGHRALYGFGPR